MLLVQQITGTSNRHNDQELMTFDKFTKHPSPTRFIRSESSKRLLVVNVKLGESRRDGASCTSVLEQRAMKLHVFYVVYWRSLYDGLRILLAECHVNRMDAAIL
jgi:hypothetical protein